LVFLFTLAARKAFSASAVCVAVRMVVVCFFVTLAARKVFHASTGCALEVSRPEGSLFSCYNAPPFSEIASVIYLLLLVASGIHLRKICSRLLVC